MFTCILLLLTVVSVATAALPYHSEIVISQFEEFVVKHNKTYNSEIEEVFRFGIFVKNLDLIDHLNKHSKYVKYGKTLYFYKNLQLERGFACPLANTYIILSYIVVYVVVVFVHCVFVK